MTKTGPGRGGRRPGAGRPPKNERTAYPIWIGQVDDETRQRILDTLMPEERLAALLAAVKEREEGDDQR